MTPIIRHSAGHVMSGARKLTLREAEGLQQDIGCDFFVAADVCRRAEAMGLELDAMRARLERNRLNDLGSDIQLALIECRSWRKAAGHRDLYAPDLAGVREGEN